MCSKTIHLFGANCLNTGCSSEVHDIYVAVKKLTNLALMYTDVNTSMAIGFIIQLELSA